jgi:hypothetical protein
MIRRTLVVLLAATCLAIAPLDARGQDVEIIEGSSARGVTTLRPSTRPAESFTASTWSPEQVRTTWWSTPPATPGMRATGPHT